MIAQSRLHLWKIESKILQSHQGSNAIVRIVDKLDVSNSHLAKKASITSIVTPVKVDRKSDSSIQIFKLPLAMIAFEWQLKKKSN